MTESLATTVEQNGSATEQLARSVQSVADNAGRISDAATAAAASATQLDQSAQSVAGLTRQGDELAKRVRRDVEDGAANVKRSIDGFGRVRESMTRSSTVIAASAVAELATALDTELAEKAGTELLAELELPLEYVLADLKTAGIAVDHDLLSSLEAEFAAQVSRPRRMPMP